MSSPEAQGEVALMLFESLLHLLVDEGIIGKEKALETIEGVAELVCEMAGHNGMSSRNRTAMTLAESIAASSKVSSWSRRKRCRTRLTCTEVRPSASARSVWVKGNRIAWSPAMPITRWRKTSSHKR